MLKPPVPKVRVIVDPRDASKDYQLPLPIAEGSFKLGLLLWDETNDCYCEPNSER
jgi:hypothetical protein